MLACMCAGVLLLRVWTPDRQTCRFDGDVCARQWSTPGSGPTETGLGLLNYRAGPRARGSVRSLHEPGFPDLPHGRECPGEPLLL